MLHELNEVLPLVTKPIRYTGGEYNSLYREPDRLRVSWVLALPEVYEIGMSNYGLRILYSILNRLENARCERCYVPWPDFGTELGKRNIRLYALESRRPVAEFNILGISLQSELSYTNLLYLLELSGIPLNREERKPEHPLVVAGGPCTVNPLPLTRFIDCFVIGDGEEPVREITQVYADWNRKNRQELMERLAGLPGLFVPGVTNPACDSVRRRIVSELKEEDFPLPPVVPICEIVHDRLTVEIARGCTRGCRFCQAGIINRPVRFRSPEQIVRLAERGIRASGWEEVSLLALSALDYPNLADLVRRLNERLKERRVSLSLPSTRGEDFSIELALELQEVKKAGLTFAPETASDRLRRFINKEISEIRVLESVRNALDAGWNGVKLYFMIGLPGETEADIMEIGRFVTEIARLCRGRLVRFNLTPFVPKPHTPLQWAGFDDITRTREKMAALKSSLTRRNIRPKWENPECAFVQALLARGDERLGAVIERVYKNGGIFQEWTEFFRFSLWQKACAEAGVDPQEFLRARSVEEQLPWDFIDVGVSREFLRMEFTRAQAGVITPDCSQAGCTGCGACPDKMPPTKPARLEIEEKKDPLKAYGRRPRPIRSYEEPKTRFRLKYAVEEPFRFAAHLDRVRAFYRALRRSELPVAWTRGFAPKPVLSFGPPLPVGLLSESEYLDIFTQFHYSGNILRDLGPFLPRGLRIVAARPVPPEYPSLGQLINLGIYEIELPEALAGRRATLQERARTIPGVRDLRLTGELRFLIGLAIVPGVKLFDRLARLLDIPEAAARTLFVRRRDCLVADDRRIRTPLGEDVSWDDLSYQPSKVTRAEHQA